MRARVYPAQASAADDDEFDVGAELSELDRQLHGGLEHADVGATPPQRRRSFHPCDEGAVDAFASVIHAPMPASHASTRQDVETKLAQLAAVCRRYKARTRQLRDEQVVTLGELAKAREALERKNIEKDAVEARMERELMRMRFRKNPKNSEAEARRKREEAHRALLFGADGGYDDVDGFDELRAADEGVGPLRRMYVRTKRFVKRCYPLNKELSRIESRFGSSVWSFFFFQRFLLLNYFYMAVPVWGFLVAHVAHLLSRQGEFTTCNTTSVEPGQEYWVWTADSWVEFVVFLPRFLMPSSYDPGQPDFEGLGADIVEANWESFRSTQGESASFLALLVVPNAILIFLMLRRWVAEDRRSLLFTVLEEAEGRSRFASAALNAWDHSFRREDEVQDSVLRHRDQFRTLAAESRAKRAIKRRTQKEIFKLYGKRALSVLVFIVVQGGCAILIVLMKTNATRFEDFLIKERGLEPASATLTSQLVVPLAVGLINALLSPVVRLLTELESWGSRRIHTNSLLLKLWLGKIFNGTVMLLSFVLLIDPVLFRGQNFLQPMFGSSRQALLSHRANLELRFKGDGAGLTSKTIGGTNCFPTGANVDAGCRLDQFGQGTFQLVLVDFVSTKMATLFMPLFWMAVARARATPYTKPEFAVPYKMVASLYSQFLAFLSFPFFPFGTLVIGGLMWVSFMFDYWVLVKFHLYQKPKKPWTAKAAGLFFIKFFVITYMISAALLLFVINRKSMPKSCKLMEAYATDVVSGYEGIKELKGCAFDPFRQPLLSSAISLADDEVCDFDKVRDKLGYAHVDLLPYSAVTMNEWAYLAAPEMYRNRGAGEGSVASFALELADSRLEEVIFFEQHLFAENLVLEAEWNATYSADMNETNTGSLESVALPVVMRGERRGYRERLLAARGADRERVVGGELRLSTLALCSLACGPFVHQVSAWQPLERTFYHYLGLIYLLVSDSAVFLWGLCAALLLYALFKRNELGVIQTLNMEREQALRGVIDVLERKIKGLNRKINLSESALANKNLKKKK